MELGLIQTDDLSIDVSELAVLEQQLMPATHVSVGFTSCITVIFGSLSLTFAEGIAVKRKHNKVKA